jgi:hypothetical protein
MNAAARPIGYDGGMGQFTLERLFAGVTFIAVGFGDIAFFHSRYSRSLHPASNPPHPLLIVAYVLLFSAGALIGAGALSPWKHEGWGAILGTAIWGALLMGRAIM